MTEAQIDQLIFAGSVLGAAAALVGIGVWVGGVNEFRKGVTNLLDGIREDIKDLRQDIQRLLHLTAGTTETGSPRWMTDAHLFRDGRHQALRIPHELELDADEVAIYRQEDRLVLEPVRPKPSLMQVLATLEALDEDFPTIEDPPSTPKQL